MLLKRRGPLIIGGLLLILGPLLILLFTLPGQNLLKAPLLLAQVLPDFPVRPLEFFTSAPAKDEVFYANGMRQVHSYLYRPEDGAKHPAVIVVLSFTPYFEDPAFVRFVEGLARSGLVVLVPDPAGLREGMLSLKDLDDLISAFEYLETQSFVEGEKIGYAGFSLGASLSLIAAADPRIAERVSYVNAFGGYYDAFTLLADVSTRTKLLDGERVAWEPHPRMLGFVQVLFLANLDNQLDAEILYAYWYQGDDMRTRDLSPGGRAVYELMKNRDPDRAPALIARLPVRMREGLELLSPRHWLNGLRAPIFIMHDVQDDYIPVSEARALAQSLPQAHYTELRFFQHILPEGPADFWGYLGQVLKLAGHIYRLLLVAT